MEIVNETLTFLLGLVFHMIQSPTDMLAFLSINAAILIGFVVCTKFWR